jgi:hypothetical protein
VLPDPSIDGTVVLGCIPELVSVGIVDLAIDEVDIGNEIFPFGAKEEALRGG